MWGGEPVAFLCHCGSGPFSLPTSPGKCVRLIKTQHENRFLQISPNPLRRLWNCLSKLIIVLICFLYTSTATKVTGLLPIYPLLRSCLFLLLPHFPQSTSFWSRNHIALLLVWMIQVSQYHQNTGRAPAHGLPTSSQSPSPRPLAQPRMFSPDTQPRPRFSPVPGFRSLQGCSICLECSSLSPQLFASLFPFLSLRFQLNGHDIPSEKPVWNQNSLSPHHCILSHFPDFFSSWHLSLLKIIVYANTHREWGEVEYVQIYLVGLTAGMWIHMLHLHFRRGSNG